MRFPHRPFILAWCIVILALVLTACGGGSPSATSPTATSAPTATPTPAAPADLVPLPDASGSFCRFDTSGHITLTIKNQGAGDAAASRAEVKYFAQSGSSSISADTTFSVAPIAAGHSLDKTTNLFN